MQQAKKNEFKVHNDYSSASVKADNEIRYHKEQLNGSSAMVRSIGTEADKKIWNDYHKTVLYYEKKANEINNNMIKKQLNGTITLNDYKESTKELNNIGTTMKQNYDAYKKELSTIKR